MNELLLIFDVDASGNVYYKNKPLKQYIDKDGYKIVSITKNNKTINAKVHRLVGLKYITNPNNKPCINHINGIKTDNRIDNLEWATHSENLKHSYKFLNRESPAKNKTGANNWSSKSVLQISLDGFILNEFESATSAYKETGICRQQICKARNGKVKTAGGYLWK